MIYLDHNATTPLHPDILPALKKAPFGNPSSLHHYGRQSKEAMETARESISQLLNTSPRNIHWFSSGSHANNQVIKTQLWHHLRTKEPIHIITSQIEHPCIHDACEFAKSLGVTITYLPVNTDGRIAPSTIEAAITPHTKLISIMYANNETGMIQPIQEIAEIAQKHHSLFHTDAIQAAGKLPIDLATLPVDYLTLSGHKFNAPKGIAALYAPKKSPLTPLIHGGPQEQQKNAGTENLTGIIGIGIAAKKRQENLPNYITHTRTLRDYFLTELLASIPHLHPNTDIKNALPNTLNISFPGLNAESLAIRLDLEGIAVSTGSACSTGSIEHASTLTAMNLPPEITASAIRFSLGQTTTKTEIDTTLETLKKITTKLRSLS